MCTKKKTRTPQKDKEDNKQLMKGNAGRGVSEVFASLLNNLGTILSR